MRILLVSVKSHKTRGGIALWTQKYLSSCQDRGVDCVLVNTEILGARSLANEITRTRRIFKDLKNALKETVDAAHLNTSCGTFGLFRDYLIARKITGKGIPLVTHYHCDIPQWVRSWLSRRCLGKLVKLSSENIVLCGSSQQFLEENYGAEASKIPNFVEETMLRRDAKLIRPRIQQALFVGRVEQAKGAEELFFAARQLPNIRFDLVGDVSRQAAKWAIPENIRLLGSLPNEQVIRLLDEADVFLLPSYTEGCSMALLEAMARGVPCIATDVGANADLLSDDCGLLIRAKNPAELVAALETLADGETRQKLSLNAVEKIRQQYTRKNMETLLSATKKAATGC